MRNDSCSCDGYVGSIYTISIGSATEEGSRSYFSEVCPSTMAVVYTGGTHRMGEQTGAKTQVVGGEGLLNVISELGFGIKEYKF